MSKRYEIRDYAAKSSTKKFHVWDIEEQREVFHTDNRDRAESLIAIAGIGPIDQHLKDRGHLWKDSAVKRYRCATCLGEPQ